MKKARAWRAFFFSLDTFSMAGSDGFPARLLWGFWRGSGFVSVVVTFDWAARA
jgi:hypothetical protein